MPPATREVGHPSVRSAIEERMLVRDSENRLSGVRIQSGLHLLRALQCLCEERGCQGGHLRLVCTHKRWHCGRSTLRLVCDGVAKFVVESTTSMRLKIAVRTSSRLSFMYNNFQWDLY